MKRLTFPLYEFPGEQVTLCFWQVGETGNCERYDAPGLSGSYIDILTVAVLHVL